MSERLRAKMGLKCEPNEHRTRIRRRGALVALLVNLATIQQVFHPASAGLFQEEKVGAPSKQALIPSFPSNNLSHPSGPRSDITCCEPQLQAQAGDNDSSDADDDDQQADKRPTFQQLTGFSFPLLPVTGE